MGQDKITMPTSTAGITRYFDDYKSKIEFKPGHIIILCIVVIVLSLLLQAYGRSLIGLQ
jgi:preprotein translocase subunit Sec61beta